MTDNPRPPGWGDDDLSKFLDMARSNQHALFANKRGWYRRLAAIDANFYRVAQNIINPKNPVAAALFYRAHSAFRAACSLSMSGQVTEAFVCTEIVIT